ncbi:ABC transporter permease [Pseudonocardia sp. WMMC193]|uniref:ABC transporter permease n=1 Tax=Pseudonocardia sp. WMMC193 TaxID=2911965 RepID=UPI001F169FFE|nr:ABC transporter permease [Pseudonocardia sp. WMMC193]MCF7548393.1 ABC transporter permease [Pseudonocardia sp. WMMC193]
MTATTTAPPQTPPSPPTPQAPRRGPRRGTGAGGWTAVAVLGLILLTAVFGPWLAPYDPTGIVGPPSQPPSAAHWGGTDATGMDVFSRTVAGTRIDVLIAVTSAVLATAFGIAVGLAVGMNEARRGPVGVLARAGSRFLDLLEAVPVVIIGLVVVSFFGTNALTMIIALAVILMPIQARLTRSEVLRVRGDAYLDAARQAGQHELRVIVRHVLPNSVRPALLNASVILGISIVLTAALGFLGVGLPPPTPEWGSMIARGAGDAAVGKWWSAAFPAVALCVTVATASVLTRRFAVLRTT